MFRDRPWSVARQLTFDVDANEAVPYVRYMVQQQEQLLSYALNADLVADFEPLHRAFGGLLASLSRNKGVRSWPRSDTATQYERLEQEYRIALMGLGGRAALLAASGGIEDADPYLRIARREHTGLRQLADDLAQALADEDRPGFSVWSNWEMEGATDLEMRAIRPERYPLAFFSLRLLELAGDSAPTLDLHGRAQQVRDWFIENVDAVDRHAQLGPQTSLDEARELALEGLNGAVRRDRLAEDEEIIARELSEDRIAAFRTGVYASVFSANTIEQLFMEAGAASYVAAEAHHAPEARETRKLVSKGFLAEEPQDAPTYWAPLNGEGYGRSAEDDALQRLCRELDRAPTTTASLESIEDLRGALDGARADLGEEAALIVLLAGDWHSVVSGAGRQRGDGFEPWWELPERRAGEILRYDGIPIIDGPDDGDRRLYIVEPGAWGCFVRAQVEGDTDLLVEVDSISAERARALLDANPNYFPDEPDEDGKLRKLQTHVEVGVAGRTGFRVVDASRARKVVAPPPAG